jgi:hypothetical protein
MIGSDTFQSADGDGLLFDTSAPTRGLAWAIAYTTENAGKNIGLAIDEVRVRELTLGDQSNVFRYIRVSGASPLTIDDAMKVIRISGIGRFHRYVAPLAITQWMPFIDDTSTSDQFEERIPNAGAAKEAGA